MSNHFTYEIDERNLRIQLKEFTVPVKEDAWHKFETFSDSMVSQHRENRLKSFNFSLNRNVVLPSVFGVIIIIFSFLLVNFVSIKNPAKAGGEKAESTLPISAPENQPKAEQAIAPVVKDQKQEELANVTPTVADVKPEEKAMITALVSAPDSAPSQIQETILPTESNSDSVASTITDEEAKAKRRAERRAARAEARKIEEIRPAPVSEERDVEEIRPD